MMAAPGQNYALNPGQYPPQQPGYYQPPPPAQGGQYPPAAGQPYYQVTTVAAACMLIVFSRSTLHAIMTEPFLGSVLDFSRLSDCRERRKLERHSNLPLGHIKISSIISRSI